MSIIAAIVVGLIVGALAKLVMPGDDPGGMLVTIALGIAGSFVGGAIGRGAGMYQPGEPAGWLMSIFGAVVLLFLYRMLAGRRASP
jgi:uncharacterized membrane protein YeaQ/YmgE (transglycosylase-associated protein family)